MKKKIVPAFLLLLFTPSCIFVISETHESDAPSQKTEEHESYESDND